MCSSRAAFLEDLPDLNFQSSSDLNPEHGPGYSRLSSVQVNQYSDAWVPGQNAVGEWMQVDFSEEKTIEAIEVRPRVENDQWVSSYKLAFSNDGIEYSFVKIVNGEDRIFSGPSAMNDFVTSTFEPTQARYIRFYPLTYHLYMAVKWDVYGCNGGNLFSFCIN